MSLEQMKEIIWKPWRNASDDANGLSSGSPESPWAPMQVPVQVTIRNPAGLAETYTARTLLIHQRGAKLECITPPGQHAKQPPFKLHQTLWIEVLSTEKADGAEVVWADTRPNADGHFEFAVELDDSRNLFDVSFLDCEKPDTPKQTAPCATTESHEAFPDLEFESAGKPQIGTERAAASQGKRSAPLLPAVPDSHRQQPNDVQDPSLPMTDRLAGVFREVIESAVQKEENAASARLVKEIRQQVAQTQQETLESLRKEITQEVSVLEEQLLEQCRSRTEHMLSAIMKTAFNALSNQIDEMAARAEQRIQGILKDLGDQLEQRSAKALAEASGRLEEQLEKSAIAIHGTIVRKVLSEINEKQKNMTEQVQKQIGLATEQNLVKLRGGLIRALQELTNEDGKRAI